MTELSAEDQKLVTLARATRGRTGGPEVYAVIEKRIERALQVVPADRIVVTPDCGLRHVPAGAARAKLHAMTTAAAAVRGRIQKEKNT